MRRFGFIVLITLLLTISTFSVSNLSMTSSMLSVIAQTSDAQKVEADRLFQQGIEQFEEIQEGQFQHQAAVESWEKALAIYREIKDSRGEIATLVQLSYGYYLRNQYQKAIEALQQPLAIARQNDDPQSVAIYLGGLGEGYTLLKQYPQAIQVFQEQLQIAQQAGDLQKEAQTLESLVQADQTLGKSQEAMHLQQQLAEVQRQTTRNAEADQLYAQGFKQFKAGQLQAATQSWQQVRTIYQEIKDRPDEARFLNNLGEVYRVYGQYQQAIQFHQQALEMARQIKYRRDEASFLSSLGTTYIYQEQSQQAIQFFEQALKIYQQVGDRTNEAESLRSLGIAYDLLGKSQEATQFHQQAVEIARLFGGRQVEANFIHEMGIVYQLLGKYQRAIQFLKQGLEINRQTRESHREGNLYRVEDLTAEVNSLDALGAAYYALGQYPQAIQVHQQALEMAQQFDGKGFMANPLRGLGNAYYSLGQYPQAIQYYQQGLEIVGRDRDFKIVYLNDLGSAYNALGQYQQAIQSFGQALEINKEIGDRRKEAKSVDGLGIAYRCLGQYQQAIQFHQQSLEIARQILDPLGEAQSLDHLGVAFLAAGNPAKAEVALLSSLQAYESLRTNLKDTDKVSIFDTQRSAYNNLQQVLIAQNKLDAALEIAERGRARAFVELLALRVSENSNNQPTIDPLTIEQIKLTAKEQNATLVEYSIINDALKTQGKQASPESELFIWVVLPSGEVAFRRVNLNSLNTSLENLVTLSRDSIGVRGRGLAVAERLNVASQSKQLKQLQQLYQLLIQPIAEFLPKEPESRVIFIPQQSLFLVPFGALQDEQGKYLIEAHTLLSVPAIQVLELTHQQRQHISGKDVLVVGNPTMPQIGEPPQQLPSLPGAEREAVAIASLFNTKAITGQDATKAAILQKLTQARIIHLATHGLLDDFNGLGVPGAIALAPSGEDNGLLTSSEILDLKLNAELVVLSACDTGRGRITGDGVIGLSRSLITAGVPSVIVSLWSIPDAPTASLMTEFYRQLQHQADKAKALRTAMLMTKEKYPNPRDWAAFSLIGEAS